MTVEADARGREMRRLRGVGHNCHDLAQPLSNGLTRVLQHAAGQLQHCDLAHTLLQITEQSQVILQRGIQRQRSRYRINNLKIHAAQSQGRTRILMLRKETVSP